MEEEDNKKVESTKFTCDAEGPELVVELVGLLLAEEGGQLLRPLGQITLQNLLLCGLKTPKYFVLTTNH